MSITAPYSYAEEDGEMELLVTKSIHAPKIPAQGIPRKVDRYEESRNRPFLTYWRTERERKALMLNRIEQTRLDASVWSLNRAKQVAERSMSHDINAARNKWSKFLRVPDSRNATRACRSASMERSHSVPVIITSEGPLLNTKKRPSTSFVRSTNCALCQRIKDLINGKETRSNALEVESPLTVIDLVRIEEPVAEDILTMYAQHLQVCPENLESSRTVSQQRSSGARSSSTGARTESMESGHPIETKPMTNGVTNDRPMTNQTNRTEPKMSNATFKTDNPSGELDSNLPEDLKDADREGLNYKMYDFLKRQKTFNTSCSVERNLAMKNELQRFQHAATHRRISLLGTPLKRPSFQANLDRKAQKLAANLPEPKTSIAVIRWSNMTYH